MIPSVNFHLWQPCNMRCRFCYATFQDVKRSILPKGHLPRGQAIEVVRHLAAHGFQKITFAGGEPTLCPWLPDLIGTAKEAGMTTMIVTNGSRLSDAYLATLCPHLDWIALSIDSLDEATNKAIGRAEPGRGALATEGYRELVDRVKAHGFRLKLNTVVNRLNRKEDLSAFIRYARPERWKLLQALPILGQNDAHIDSLTVTEAEFEAFVERHATLEAITRIVPESNAQIRGSYVMVDPAGRFFENSEGTHRYSLPILEVGAHIAMQQMCYDERKFEDRGGLWGWKEEVDEKRIVAELAEQGVSMLPRTPYERFRGKVDSLGTTILRTEVRVRPESKAMVTSPRSLDLHTDHHAARYIAWYCHRQSEQGGESLLLDARTAFDQLAPEHRDRLFTLELHEHKVFPEDPGSWPFVMYDQGKLRFYFSFWLTNPSDRDDPAFQAFQQALADTPRIELKLRPGDALIIDNHRMLHGRKAIGADGDRYLERFWIK
ncbi:MAG: TauD/TfdA family dioxygenase [Flavobacteriales bacterium]|nr:TauD/TfdA family dioxygenase [Flavobacteriales bacterium]MCB9200545.1 TauD/TfdA family dioxygenase [Flavobacteriales bacterium]